MIPKSLYFIHYGGGTGLTGAETAAAVLDALAADHAAAGTIGAKINTPITTVTVNLG